MRTIDDRGETTSSGELTGSFDAKNNAYGVSNKNQMNEEHRDIEAENRGEPEGFLLLY